MSLLSFKKLCITLLLASFHLLAQAQQSDSAVQKQNADSGRSTFVTRLQKMGHQETINSIEKYRSGR
jgi:hypothetical protein